jgi:hypothetical protein
VRARDGNNGYGQALGGRIGGIDELINT